MNPTKQETNKELVLEAFDTLFNKRDYVTAERYWSPNYIQHSDHIAPGREGLFELVKTMPWKFKYEPGTIVAENNLVIVHGRFSGFGQPVNWDCSGHPSHRGRPSGRALGYHPGRKDTRAVQERPSHVRQQVSDLNMRSDSVKTREAVPL
jgi:hypothetical protein